MKNELEDAMKILLPIRCSPQEQRKHHLAGQVSVLWLQLKKSRRRYPETGSLFEDEADLVAAAEKYMTC
jgi:hypothetical protein